MKVIGLTGGIGMGKSASASLLRARGVPVIDTDDLARQVVEPGQPALGKVREVFGAEVLDPAGCVRRDELARRVFNDADARRRLEEILHPPIRALWKAQIAKWRGDGAPLAVVVIPLLYETRAEGEFDAIVCVACSTATQRQRLQQRGWSPVEIERRIEAQLPAETKVARADFVIWTEGDMAIHEEQMARIVLAIAPA